MGATFIFIVLSVVKNGIMTVDIILRLGINETLFCPSYLIRL